MANSNMALTLFPLSVQEASPCENMINHVANTYIFALMTSDINI